MLFRSTCCFLQRRYTDSQQTHEKMLNITNHQENANQNHNELSPHTCYDSHYPKKQKTTSVDEDVDKLKHIHCWWECKMVQPLWKTAGKFLQKLKIELLYDPAIPLLGIYPQELRVSKRYLYSHIHSSLIHNS